MIFRYVLRHQEHNEHHREDRIEESIQNGEANGDKRTRDGPVGHLAQASGRALGVNFGLFQSVALLNQADDDISELETFTNKEMGSIPT